MYQEMIVKRLLCLPSQARYVEAYMRLEHPTLDGLSSSAFTREARIGLQCMMASTSDENESLAQSYGL